MTSARSGTTGRAYRSSTLSGRCALAWLWALSRRRSTRPSAADAVTRRLHPEPYRTYNIDRNINYTNVCAVVCDFCAFYRKSNDADAYVLPREELYQKIEETIALGGDQVLMQGGNHPSLKLEWYEDLLRDLKARFPSVNLHAFSASEIWHFHKLNKLPLPTVLERLKAAGMGSLPGGGAEILTDRVRKAITVNKVLTDERSEEHTSELQS